MYKKEEYIIDKTEERHGSWYPDKGMVITDKRPSEIPCCICGFDDLRVIELHHIIPKSMFGKDDASNLVPLCPNCHKTLHQELKILIKNFTWKSVDNKNLEKQKDEHGFKKEKFQIQLDNNNVNFERNKKIESNSIEN